ncbi:hypothetical protein [Cellulomonas sp. FA1]|jgi:hypothetical protein|uniref:hypothetical protein n=1 Tax=Cellulomonas sp. FA1 TaxID=1346710 RepID=UPI00069AFCAD|nr:hypothetical protein [Cellulomonas sp. FA1]
MSTSTAPSTAAPAPSTSDASPDPTAGDLHLLHILESGIAAEVGTPAEPSRYTVPVVFSRQVTPVERARIEDPATARRLGEAVSPGRGGPELRLVVSDRRLLVENTTLAELRDGLAAELAAFLRELGEDVRAASAERVTAAARRAGDAERRDATVHAAVEQIRFV